jgi:hypothetical protein
MVRAGLMLRLAVLERRVDPPAGWQDTRGLAALLAYAKQHPRAPGGEDMDDEVDAPPTGLARLLWQARQQGPPQEHTS